MKSKIPFAGRHRVVIDRLSPSVDGGQFPFKRVLGDQIRFEAHLIADGHDKIRARFCYRRRGEKAWTELSMRDEGNDVYAVDWTPEDIGVYEYDVAAWCDAFDNWHAGFVKKAANQDPQIAVEVQIGADLIKAATKRCKGDPAKELQSWVAHLENDSVSLEDKSALLHDTYLYDRVHAQPDRSLETRLPQPALLTVERELAVFSSWYEYFPRSCVDDGKTHGTFRDAEKRLAEIAEMGFNVVYFPPIHPIGEKNRKGRNNALEAADGDVGSPWAIGSAKGGHKSIHPELGSEADFQHFMEAAQAQGLEVALDIAFQCAPDHPYVKEHPKWFKWRPDGTVQYAENPPKKYQDILPFDFETEDWQALWLELKSVFEFWIEKGVRIFRVDNPHTKAMEFWRWCLLELKTQYPDTVYLAEAFTRPKRKYRLAKAGFTQGYTYFTWRNHAAEMRSYLEELTQSEVSDYFWPNFWPNTPDILHEDLQKGTRATFIGRYALAATLSSSIGIYGPAYEVMDHEPFPGKEEYNNNEKYQLKTWDWEAPGNIRAEISRINRIRNQNRALQRTNNLIFADTDNEHLLAYIKQDFGRSNQIITVVNMDWRWTQMGHVTLPLDVLGISEGQRFRIRDLFDPRETVYEWEGARNFVKLDPTRTPVHIFRVER